MYVDIIHLLGTGELRREHVWGLTLGKNSEDELVFNIPKIHNDNDYRQYEITRITVPEIETVFIKAYCSFIHHTREKWHPMRNRREREK
jgi:hypothetical protein